MQNMNFSNQNNININNLFISQNKKLLLNKIINFYQKSGRYYMNYNQLNQIRQLINNLDTNSPILKEGKYITDPLPYV